MNTVDVRPWTALLAVTVLAAAVLRFASLQSGLWLDEIVTLVLSARRPLSQIVTEFADVNVHPLYSVLAHASTAVFGESAWALRLPACLFGIGCVAMVYACAALVATRVEAWAAAAVLTVSYHHIWFSQNARGYTMVAFFALVSTYVLLRPGPTWRNCLLYGLACVAGIYTHLTMVFIVAGQAAVVMAGHARRQAALMGPPLRPLLLAYVAIALCTVAAYAPLGAGLLAMAGDETSATAQVATPSWAIAEVVRSLFSGGGAVTMLLLLVLAGTGAASLWRRHQFASALLVAPGVVTVLAVVVSGQPLRPRFVFFMSGAAAIFVGRGIGAVAGRLLARRGVSVTAATVLCTLALVAMSSLALPRNYRIPKQDFDGAVRFLETAESQGSRIMAAGPACIPLRIYFGKTWPCVESLDSWRAVSNAGSAQPVLLVHTLSEYIEDPGLLNNLRTQCPEVRRFEGTLGGGDLVVCEVSRQRASR